MPEQQGGSFQTPATPQIIRGFPENFQLLVFDGFDGLNTKPTRPALQDQQCFWLDNWMPLGKNNIRTLYDIGPILFTSTGITTWNPLDEANILLSNGNLTATASSSVVIGAVRATTKKLTGKHYFECVHQNVASTTGSVGVGDGTASEANFVGFDAHGYGLRPNGQLYHNNVVVTTINTYNIGDTVGVAIDCGNLKAWWRTNTGNWNNDPSANPTTNTNGIDVSGITQFFPMVNALVLTIGAAPQFTIWNAADTSGGTVLNNGYVLTNGGGTRTVAGKTTGKYYVEITFNTNAGANLAGVCQSTANLANWVPKATGGAGVNAQGDSIFVNGANAPGNPTIGAFSPGDIVCIAFDIGNALVWFRKNNGNWNANGAANPAAGTGGISTAALTGTFMVCGGFTVASQFFIGNFGNTGFAFTPPTGFTVGWPA